MDDRFARLNLMKAIGQRLYPDVGAKSEEDYTRGVAYRQSVASIYI
jgi:hypothetical protein